MIRSKLRNRAASLAVGAAMLATCIPAYTPTAAAQQ